MSEHFFIVGAQRCATSYLYHLLDEHPQIEMARPLRPEPKFFFQDAEYGQDIEYYKKKFFPGKPSARFRGEKGTSYMESVKAAARIAEAFPSAKIIFMLRNPIDRAISNYRFSVENGLENLTMEEAFRKESDRIENFDPHRVSVSPYAYLRRGRYIDYIKIYSQFFPSSRIFLIVSEKFIGSMPAVRDLFSFIGADGDFVPAGIRRIVNASRSPRHSSTTPSEALLHFMRDYFKESNRQLADAYGLDLKDWQTS